MLLFWQNSGAACTMRSVHHSLSALAIMQRDFMTVGRNDEATESHGTFLLLASPNRETRTGSWSLAGGSTISASNVAQFKAFTCGTSGTCAGLRHRSCDRTDVTRVLPLAAKTPVPPLNKRDTTLRDSDSVVLVVALSATLS